MPGLIKVTWTQFKATYNLFTTPITYLEETEQYDIWMYVNGREYNCILAKTSPASADQIDFETNFKALSNINQIWTSGRATASGELIISQPPPSPPPNTTQIVKQYFIDSATQQNDFYTVTNGKILVIQRFRSASGAANNVTNNYLYLDDTGTGSPLVLIELIILNGNQFSYDLNYPITGNGVRRILTRRDPLGGGTRIMFSKWEGFERT